MDAKTSAVLSGYKRNPDRKGRMLLAREDIAQEIMRISFLRKEMSSRFAKLGLEKLAFGSISDAVSLLYMKEPGRDELEKMDLCCISEIKTKDGYMEIKFIDRLRALEKLCQEEVPQNDKADSTLPPIYNAILKGAAALNSSDSHRGCEDGN